MRPHPEFLNYAFCTALSKKISRQINFLSFYKIALYCSQLCGIQIYALKRGGGQHVSFLENDCLFFVEISCRRKSFTEYPSQLKQEIMLSIEVQCSIQWNYLNA